MIETDAVPPLPAKFLMSDFVTRPRTGRFPFVFIVTYGRTGSTLLLGLLNALPGYEIRGENSNALFNLYKAVRSVAYAKQAWGDAKAHWHSWYGAAELDPARFRARLVDLFVEEVLVPGDDDQVLGLKEIRHTPLDMTDREFEGYLVFLREAFPGCGLIFNVRDPAAAAISGFWSRTPDPAKVLEIIGQTRVRIEKAAAADPAALLLDYDEWMRDPAYVERLFAFLGESYDPAMVERVLATRHGLT